MFIVGNLDVYDFYNFNNVFCLYNVTHFYKAKTGHIFFYLAMNYDVVSLSMKRQDRVLKSCSH